MVHWQLSKTRSGKLCIRLSRRGRVGRARAQHEHGEVPCLRYCVISRALMRRCRSHLRICVRPIIFVVACAAFMRTVECLLKKLTLQRAVKPSMFDVGRYSISAASPNPSSSHVVAPPLLIRSARAHRGAQIPSSHVRVLAATSAPWFLCSASLCSFDRAT